jgi:hypothetical protein
MMARTRKWRTWKPAAEEALEELTRAVEDALNRGRGTQAAREAVPEWAGVDSISELARKAKVDRASLSMALAAEGPYWTVRSALDKALGLPPGGMTRVLSMVEEARG